MEVFVGVNIVVCGNCIFGMFLNYFENVDDVLCQWVGVWFLVDGF